MADITLDRREFIKLTFAVAAGGAAAVACRVPMGESEKTDENLVVSSRNDIVLGLALLGGTGEGVDPLFNEKARILLETGFPVQKTVNVGFVNPESLPPVHQAQVQTASWSVLKSKEGWPYDVLVNTQIDPAVPSGETLRFLKVANRTDNTLEFLEDSIRIQRVWLTSRGVPEELVNSLVYMTDVVVDGVQHRAGAMNHLGQSLFAMVTEGGSGVTDELVLRRVANLYNRALVDAIEFYKNTGNYQSDPNLGNFTVFQYVDDTGTTREVIHCIDFANRSRSTPGHVNQMIVDKILRRAGGHAKNFGLPGVISNVDELDAFVNATRGIDQLADSTVGIEAVLTTQPAGEPRLIQDVDSSPLGVDGVPEEQLGEVIELRDADGNTVSVDTGDMKLANSTTYIDDVPKTKFGLILEGTENLINKIPGGRIALRFGSRLIKPILKAFDVVGLMGALWVVHSELDPRKINSIASYESEEGRFLIAGAKNLDQLWSSLLEIRVKRIFDNLQFIPGAREDLKELISVVDDGSNYVDIENRVRKFYVNNLLNTSTYGSVRFDVRLRDAAVFNNQTELEIVALGDGEKPAIVFLKVNRDESGNLLNYSPLGVYNKAGTTWQMVDIGLNTDFAVYKNKSDGSGENVFLRLQPPDDFGNLNIMRAIKTQG